MAFFVGFSTPVADISSLFVLKGHCEFGGPYLFTEREMTKHIFFTNKDRPDVTNPGYPVEMDDQASGAVDAIGALMNGKHELIKERQRAVNRMYNMGKGISAALNTYTPVEGEEPPEWYQILTSIAKNPNQMTAAQQLEIIKSGALTPEQRKKAVHALFKAMFGPYLVPDTVCRSDGEEYLFRHYQFVLSPFPGFILFGRRNLAEEGEEPRYSGRLSRIKALNRLYYTLNANQGEAS